MSSVSRFKATERPVHSNPHTPKQIALLGSFFHKTPSASRAGVLRVATCSPANSSAPTARVRPDRGEGVRREDFLPRGKAVACELDNAHLDALADAEGLGHEDHIQSCQEELLLRELPVNSTALIPSAVPRSLASNPPFPEWASILDHAVSFGPGSTMPRDYRRRDSLPLQP